MFSDDIWLFLHLTRTIVFHCCTVAAFWTDYHFEVLASMPVGRPVTPQGSPAESKKWFPGMLGQALVVERQNCLVHIGWRYTEGRPGVAAELNIPQHFDIIIFDKLATCQSLDQYDNDDETPFDFAHLVLADDLERHRVQPRGGNNGSTAPRR